MGSTLYFKSIEEYRKAEAGEVVLEGQLCETKDNSYGLLGNPSIQRLAKQITELEQATKSLIYPSGTSANSHAMLALSRAGDTIFVPDACYNPIKHFARTVLSRYDINVEFYNPLNLDTLESRVTEKTSLIMVESPVSNTFEVVDLDRILEIAKKVNAFSAIDATWSSGILAKFIPRGFDISTIAITKYLAGYSDVLMGSVSTSNSRVLDLLEVDHHAFGVYTSPFDVTLVERGLESARARMRQAALVTAELVKLFDDSDKVEKVNMPSRNKNFDKYFEGESCLFSIELKREYNDDELQKMFDHFEVFSIGASWGGTHSLVLPYLRSAFQGRSVAPKNTLIRFNIGLEPIEELAKEIKNALEALPV